MLFFAYLMYSSVSGAKALKTFVRFAIFNFSKKLQNIFEKGLKKYGVIVQKSQTYFYLLYVKLATV